MDLAEKSVLEMAMGVILERVDHEMVKVLQNIMDSNTDPTAKRKMVLTLEFKPDAYRKNIALSVMVKTALAPTVPVVTSLYVCGADSNGQQTVVEMVPQVPGQQSISGEEQCPPAKLKLVNFDA